MVARYLASNRFGLGTRQDGPATGDLKAWLIDQLDDYDPAPPALASLVDRKAIAETYMEYSQVRRAASRKLAKVASRKETGVSAGKEPGSDILAATRRHYADAATARLTNAVATSTPFPEKLVHFWSNHFAISADNSGNRLCWRL